MRLKTSNDTPHHLIQTGTLLLVVAVMTVCCAGCMGNGAEQLNTQKNTAETEVTYTGSNVETVELYHFHGDRSCTSCVVLGDFAEETVTEWYAPELESGRLVFAHVNYDEPEAKDLVERYHPTGSSLWIGVSDENGFYKQELVAPWYMLSDKDEYSQYLRAVIEQQIG